MPQPALSPNTGIALIASLSTSLMDEEVICQRSQIFMLTLRQPQ